MDAHLDLLSQQSLKLVGSANQEPSILYLTLVMEKRAKKVADLAEHIRCGAICRRHRL
jgi:hypothetical protein